MSRRSNTESPIERLGHAPYRFEFFQAVRILETWAASQAKAVARDPDVKRLENQISEKLGAGVKIKSGKKGAGQLIISFNSSAELEGIIGHLKE